MWFAEVSHDDTFFFLGKLRGKKTFLLVQSFVQIRFRTPDTLDLGLWVWVRFHPENCCSSWRCYPPSAACHPSCPYSGCAEMECVSASWLRAKKKMAQVVLWLQPAEPRWRLVPPAAPAYLPTEGQCLHEPTTGVQRRNQQQSAEIKCNWITWTGARGRALAMEQHMCCSSLLYGNPCRSLGCPWEAGLGCQLCCMVGKWRQNVVGVGTDVGSFSEQKLKNLDAPGLKFLLSQWEITPL